VRDEVLENPIRTGRVKKVQTSPRRRFPAKEVPAEFFFADPSGTGG